MQNVVNYLAVGGGNFDEEDIFYPCNKIDEKFAPACYQYQNTYIANQNMREIIPTFNDCDRIVPEKFVKYCYHGMGRELESFTNSTTIKGAAIDYVSLCTLGQKTEYHNYCLRGLVMTVVNGNTNPIFGFLLCSEFPEKFKVDCYDAMGKWAHMLHSTYTDREKECSKAESSEYFEFCMNASLESIELL